MWWLVALVLLAGCSGSKRSVPVALDDRPVLPIDGIERWTKETDAPLPLTVQVLPRNIVRHDSLFVLDTWETERSGQWIELRARYGFLRKVGKP